MGVKTRNLGNSEGKDIQWQQPLNADGSTIFNVEAGKGYFCDTTSGAFTVTLPAGVAGSQIAVVDYARTFASSNLLIVMSADAWFRSLMPLLHGL